MRSHWWWWRNDGFGKLVGLGEGSPACAEGQRSSSMLGEKGVTIGGGGGWAEVFEGRQWKIRFFFLFCFFESWLPGTVITSCKVEGYELLKNNSKENYFTTDERKEKDEIVISIFPIMIKNLHN